MKALTHRSYHIMILITLCICTLNPIIIKKYKFKTMTFCKNMKEGKFSKCVQCSNTPHPNTYNVIRHTVSVTHTNARIYKHTQHANTPTQRAAAEEAAAVSHFSRVFCMIVSTLQKRRWIVRIWWVAAHVGQKRGNERNCKKQKRKNHTRNPLTILNIQLHIPGDPWVLSWGTLQQQPVCRWMRLRH